MTSNNIKCQNAHWVLTMPVIDNPGEVVTWPSKELRIKSIQTFQDGVLVFYVEAPLYFHEQDILALFDGTTWPRPAVHLCSAYPWFQHKGMLPVPDVVRSKLGRKPLGAF